MTGTRVKIQYRGVVSEIYQTSKLTIGVSSNLLGKLQKLEKHVTTADPTRPDLVDKKPQSRSGDGIQALSGTSKPDLVPVRQACFLHPHRDYWLGTGHKSKMVYVIKCIA